MGHESARIQGAIDRALASSGSYTRCDECSQAGARRRRSTTFIMSRKVGLGEIAEIAGVSRQAVSNWRKRYPDFPSPTGGSRSAPVFDWRAVERWLIATGRGPLTDVEDVWRRRDADAIRAEIGASRYPVAVAAVLADRTGLEVGPVGVSKRELSRVAAHVDTLLDGHGPAEVLEEALTGSLEITAADDSDATPGTLAAFLAGLLPIGPGASVADPAAGEGWVLLAVHRQHPDARLVARELDADVLAVLQVRMQLHGVEIDAEVGDSLRDRNLGPADVVLLDPPFGLPLGDLPGEWPFGLPSTGNSDFVWLQVALAALHPDGRAAVVLPRRSLSHGGDVEIRNSLVEAGRVEAVICLPDRLRSIGGVELAVWVLRGWDELGADVLLVDGSEMGYRARERRLLRTEEIGELIHIYRTWAASGKVDDSGVAVAIGAREACTEGGSRPCGASRPPTDSGCRGEAAYRRTTSPRARVAGSCPGGSGEPRTARRVRRGPRSRSSSLGEVEVCVRRRPWSWVRSSRVCRRSRHLAGADLVGGQRVDSWQLLGSSQAHGAEVRENVVERVGEVLRDVDRHHDLVDGLPLQDSSEDEVAVAAGGFHPNPSAGAQWNDCCQHADLPSLLALAPSAFTGLPGCRRARSLEPLLML
jgi:hypothetical protein